MSTAILYSLAPMILEPAQNCDIDAVADLVNGAYRGQTSRAGWTHEADLLEGQRTSAQALRGDLAAKPQAVILILREAAATETLGAVWLEPAGERETWYLGMLTVRPTLQDRKLGRTLLAMAEAFASERGARKIAITVVSIRLSLIAWYHRRGYQPTGEMQLFPYADQRFGAPLRDDLEFQVMAKTLES